MYVICKVQPWAKLACMINADLEAIDHVSGSFLLGRFLHEVIVFTMLGRRLPEVSAVCCESDVCVENCVLSF